MFEFEEDNEPISAEYEKHKRKREQRKKDKTLLLEVKHLTEMLSLNPSVSSELRDVKETIKSFDASPVKSLYNVLNPAKSRIKNRRKLRAPKNSAMKTLDNNIESELCGSLKVLEVGQSSKGKTKSKSEKARIKKTDSKVNGGFVKPKCNNYLTKMTDDVNEDVFSILLDSIDTTDEFLTDTTDNFPIDTTDNYLTDTAENFLVDKTHEFFDTTDNLTDTIDEFFDTTDNLLIDTTDNLLIDTTDEFLIDTTDNLLIDTSENFLIDTTNNFFTDTIDVLESDSSSKITTPKKTKTSLTANNVTPIGSVNNSKSARKRKVMPSPQVSKAIKDKKSPKNGKKDKFLKDGTPKQILRKSTEPTVKFGKYMSPTELEEGLKRRELFIGNIRINPKDHKLSYISNPVQDEQDFLLTSITDRNGALEGDEVVVKLKDEAEWKSNNQKIGYVVYILKQVHPRTAVGVLKLMDDKNKKFAIFQPRDSRIPRMKIPFTDWPESFFEKADYYENVLFLAKITKWVEPRFTIGTILKQIGLVGEIVAESQAILAGNCLDVTPYANEMKQYFPKTAQINPEEFEYRMDLRKECIFTIDPLTARDLDDAVSCKLLPNGNLEIGVHIADVSYFLKEDTPLDEIVAQKATSIYMVESVYHMLPKELCMMCSLLPGEDKLAFSVIWEMTSEGEVISHKFTRSVINSCVQLAYEHAQMMIENPSKEFKENELPEIHNGYKPEDLKEIVNNLHKIALILRQSRYQSGALRIDQPKISFSLNPANGLPVSYCLYENKECHRLIEEFMLLANITVATRLRSDYPDIAFLRNHSTPHEYMMNRLKMTLEKVGIHLDVSSAGGLQQTLWKYTGEDTLSQARMLVLNLLCAKPMVRANYFCAENSNDAEYYWHYALSVPLYTHFTSPIRRYADIIVHRQLAGSLGYTEKPTWCSDYVTQIANICNTQKYNAKRAGEQSIELYLIHYIGEHQPMIEKAVVMDVKNNSFDAIVIANGLSIRFYLNNLDEGVSYRFLKEEGENVEEKDLLNLLVEWPAQNDKPSTSQIIALFSLVTVSLSKVEKALKLNIKLIRPET